VLRSAMPIETPLRMRSYFTLCAGAHRCLSYSEHRQDRDARLTASVWLQVNESRAVASRELALCSAGDAPWRDLWFMPFRAPSRYATDAAAYGKTPNR